MKVYGHILAMLCVLPLVGSAEDGIRMIIRAENPTFETQTVAVAEALPAKVTRQDAVQCDGLDLKGFSGKGFSVEKQVTLGPKETLTFMVDMRGAEVQEQLPTLKNRKTEKGNGAVVEVVFRKFTPDVTITIGEGGTILFDGEQITRNQIAARLDRANLNRDSLVLVLFSGSQQNVGESVWHEITKRRIYPLTVMQMQ